MALTPTQEAQVLQLVAEQAALLSLADNEATIISKLGATKVNLSSLGSAVTFDDADIMLIRQGTTDLSIAGSLIKSTVAVPDATDTVKGKSSLAVAANYPSVSDTESATPAYVSSAVAAAPSVTGLFSNLKSSATGLSALVTITADELVVKSGTNYKTLTNVSVTPSLAASGANGLDTGTSAISTWYADFVIWNPTTLAVAGLFSLSSTAPTMPAGYTHKARVGWIRSDSTANKYPLSFKQFGNKVRYTVTVGNNVPALPIIASGIQGSVTVPTWVDVSWASVAPITTSLLSVSLSCTSSGMSAMAAPNASYGAINSLSNPPPITAGNSSSIVTINSSISELAVETLNIYYASVGSGARLLCIGWEDNL